MIEGIKRYLKKSESTKRIALYLLMPGNQARPRWWVSIFVNPFVHKTGRRAVIRRSTRMDVLPFNSFRLGDDATIEDFAVINNGVGEVSIGNRTMIGISSVLIGPLQIGNDVMLAQHVVISALNHGYADVTLPISLQPVTTKPVVIEDEAWIGANAVITAGVRVGKHAVVAAGSVVTKDVLPYSIVAGNPARLIKKYNALTGAWESVAKEPASVAVS